VRVEFAAAIYRQKNRGDRRESTFLDDDDRNTLLSTFAKAGEKTDLQVHA